MTDETQNEAASERPSRLAVLKMRADTLGISYSNNIGEDTLAAKIREHTEALEKKAAEPVQESILAPNPLKADAESITGFKAPANVSERERIFLENTRLVRLRIQNMDPKKKDLPGEILTVANEIIGTVRKFIPYGEATENGYHVPYVLYKMMKNKKFLNIRTVKDPRTRTNRVEVSWQREYALEVLPQLTQQELQDLATAQIAAGSIDQFQSL